MKRKDISMDKFKALAEAVGQAGEQNKIEPIELITGLCQLIQSLMGRDKMTITFKGERIEIK